MPSEPRPGAPLVGITGGIACGKSEVGQVLSASGVAVVDADDIAHRVMEPGGEVYERVVEAFGPDVVCDHGAIDRVRLGRLVFADPAAREKLNGLVHPAVLDAVAHWVAEQRAAGESGAVIIPLLFEAGADQGWDAILCVSAAPGVVKERLTKRGLTEKQAEERLAAQWPLDEKKARSNFVIENNGTLPELRRDVLRVWTELSGKEMTYHG